MQKMLWKGNAMEKLMSEFYKQNSLYGEKELKLAMQVMEFSLNIPVKEHIPTILHHYIKESVREGDYEDYASVNVLQVVKDKINQLEINGPRGIRKLRDKIFWIYDNKELIAVEDMVLSDEGDEVPFYLLSNPFLKLAKDKKKMEKVFRLKEFQFFFSNCRFLF